MALSAEGISKSYGRKAVVLDVSLRVEQSEIVGLLGSNGAGKTTSFYCIVGISKVDGGTITIDDVNVTNMPMHNRARLGLGYLPQEASVFRRLTTRQNIAAVLDLCKDRPRAQRPARIEELLAEFDLTRVAETRGERLSGGERRRLEIARALAANPKYLLFDEPFAGVDPISVEEIKKNLLGLSKRGIGVLITDHNVRETLDLTHRSYIVHAGSIIAEGDTDTLLANQKVRDVYLGGDFRI